MVTGPDIAAFQAAQDRLIDATGTPVVFRTPQPETYAPDVALDPESGEPYDPTAVPTSGGGYDEVVVPVGLVTRKDTTGAARVEATPVGFLSNADAACLVKAIDWPTVQNATQFFVNGQTFRIVRANHESFTASADRFVIFGEAL